MRVRHPVQSPWRPCCAALPPHAPLLGARLLAPPSAPGANSRRARSTCREVRWGVRRARPHLLSGLGPAVERRVAQRPAQPTMDTPLGPVGMSTKATCRCVPHPLPWNSKMRCFHSTTPPPMHGSHPIPNQTKRNNISHYIRPLPRRLAWWAENITECFYFLKRGAFISTAET